MQKVRFITGASYGDEGKGLATDFFASQAEGRIVTVLTNGGPQRGHTVELADGRRHIFKHFGAGTFRGAETYFAPQFMVNPMEFVKEHAVLSDMHTSPVAYADPSCRVTTPWDMLMSQFLSEKNGMHNTCGYGIWETVLRYSRGCGLTLGTLAKLPADERHTYLCMVRDRYFPGRVEELGLAAWLQERKDLVGIFFSEGLIRHYEEDLETMLAICPIRGEHFLKGFETVLFENAQGLLLDGNAEEEKENTTPSTTGIGRVIQMAEKQFRGADIEAAYVTRSYLTRHGDGSMENEIQKGRLGTALPGVMPDQTNVGNLFQGKLRYGLLDEKKLTERVLADFGKSAAARNNNYMCSIFATHLNEHGVDAGFLADMTGGTVYLSDGKTAEDTHIA